MQAVQYERFGSPEVLKMVDVATPVPGRGEIRVTVRAAGLNPLDWKVFGGMTGGDPSQLPQGVGRDYSGVVDATGEGVTDFTAGDAVLGTVRGAPGLGMTSGSLAEELVVPADWVVHKPDALGFTEAAALGVASQAAAGALRTLGLSAGDAIVISGASGGVGSLAVQFAVHRGATVIGIAGEQNLDHVRSLGAIPVAYGENLESRVLSATPAPVTRFLDCHGTGYIDLALGIGLAPDAIATLVPSPEAIANEVLVTGSRDSLPDDLPHVADLVARGAIKVHVAHAYPFEIEDVREAYTELRKGHVRGKLVVSLS